jgi:hypothetical protein
MMNDIEKQAEDEQENKFKEAEDELKKQKKKKVLYFSYLDYLPMKVCPGVSGGYLCNSSNDINMYHGGGYRGFQGIIFCAKMIDNPLFVSSRHSSQ